METPTSFEIGKVYNRAREIHDAYGGGRQSGISTPKDRPLIFLFTGDMGQQHGYQDGWDVDGVFLYSGEGQHGDMAFVRGNRAIRDHAANSKDLLVFESVGKGKGYRYLGTFACGGWEQRQGVDSDGHSRQVILFRLLPQDEPAAPAVSDTSKKSIDELRRAAYRAATPSSVATSTQAKRSYYERSEDVRVYVLARAKGVCESCQRPAPFVRNDGSNYLEPHHLRRVSDGGPDHPRWVAAICPNCHREIHHGASGAEKNEALVKHLGIIEATFGSADI